MRKIVFFCIPAHGHTNPTLGVVRELTARGHQVLYYSYDAFRTQIEAAGAEFASCDRWDCEQQLTSADGARLGSDLVFSTQVLVDTTLALNEPVCRRMEELQPDCIVGDSMAFWAKAVARKLDIPFVSSTTTFAFNRESAGMMRQGGLRELAGMLLSMGRANRQIRRLQEKGFPVKNVLSLIANDNDTDTVVYTSKEFQPCADSFSDRYAFVGPSVRPVETPFVKNREKLLYISMGTVNNDLLPLYRSCVEAFRGWEGQVVISAGDQVELSALGELPEHITVHRRVDQMAVLEQADAFITHCGMNSVSEALWSGVPLVLLPQTKEQEAVAARTEQLGAGLRPGGTDPQALAAAVQKLLAEPSFRESARRIGEGFRACSGAGGAADKILSVCRKG